MIPDLEQLKLESAIKECDSHLARLDRGYALLADIFPVDAAVLAGLDEVRVEQLDQFLFRFAKLQDAMGSRLFLAVDWLISGKNEARPFFDILANLEKYHAIESADSWQAFRELRNNLSHEYPDNAAESAITLNLLFAQWPAFRGIYTRLRDFAASAAR